MDFTMGSGSTGIACMNTKRKFIGVEMNKDILKSLLEEQGQVEKNLQQVEMDWLEVSEELELSNH